MKSRVFICMLTAALALTGCQSFQFVESPIPVRGIPVNTTFPDDTPTINTVLIKDTSAHTRTLNTIRAGIPSSTNTAL